MKRNDFFGIKSLVGLALRRDRLKLPLWLVGISLMILSIVHAYAEFSAQEMKDMIIMAAANPGMRLFVAPISMGVIGDIGTFFLFRMSFIIAIMVGIMSIQIVVRHTRHNEETGCAELLSSTVLGRYASLTAALIVAICANIILSFMMAFAMIAGGLPAGGSFVAGFSFGAFGIIFAGIAAICVQLSENSRGSSGLASMALAFVFLINAVGNILGKVNAGGLGYESAWPVWLSPLGWVQQMHAYDENNWWILILFVVLLVPLVYSAFILVNRRDIGRGILAAKPGPGDAPKSLLSPLGLAWRLQRGALLGWMIPIALFALIFGGASQDFGETIEGVEMFEQVLAAAAENFGFMMISVMSVIISIYTMQSLLRKRTEEDGGPLEAVLATPVKRSTWMASHIICSVVGTLILLVIFALGLAVASEATSSQTIAYIKMALYQGSGIIALAGCIIAVYGLLPRISRTLSWVVVMFAMLAGPFFGALLDLPEGLQEISPFSHVGLVPADITASGIIILIIVGVLLGAIGMVSFNRRNLSL